MKTRFSYAVLLVVLVGAAGCSGSTDVESQPDPDPVPADQGLFDCAPLQPACEEMFYHLSPEPAAALQCAAELVASGELGVIVARDTPGPYLDEIQTMVILLGDGTAVVQRRERHCKTTEEDCSEPVPWEAASDQQNCDIVSDAQLGAACAEGTDDCSWSPWGGLGTCELSGKRSCEDVSALLQDSE